ncbi:MAG: flavoprotein [Solirubrobacterales bacterium]|nr:flavoprotein [Solirubrobacterales bacterium]
MMAERSQSAGGETRVAAICGSLQRSSANAAMLRAALREAPEGMTIEPFRGLAEVPAMSPELDGEGEGAPAAVWAWRRLLRGADGLLIVSPEYAHSMPGVLKNALDWLVGSGELSNMPVALISASSVPTGGIRAQMALTQTLLAQAAHVDVALTVPGVKAKLGADGELVHAPTLRRVRETLVALVDAIAERPPRLVR